MMSTGSTSVSTSFHSSFPVLFSLSFSCIYFGMRLVSHALRRWDSLRYFCHFNVTENYRNYYFYFQPNTEQTLSLYFLDELVLSGRYAAKFRLKIAKRTDERGGLMNEIIVGMRVIKMYAWEKPFTLLIDGVRR
jgi:hypothetical protein